MQYLLIVKGYPSSNNIYNNGFVHRRVKQYLIKGLDVIVYNVDNKLSDYEYDGVKVIAGNLSKLRNILKENDYKKILIHFGYKRIVKTVLKVNKKTPVIMWVHGVEALGWYRRTFLVSASFRSLIRYGGYMVVNTEQMLYMRRLIKNYQGNILLIFVSKWMKDILEIDTLTSGKIHNYRIIPNVIDNSVFKYDPKIESSRLKVLSIRPFSSTKYANDLTVETILAFSKVPYFREFTFEIIGDGRLFEETVKPLRQFENVIIKKGFLSQSEIANKHKEYGVFLAPTRQDSQGVSMCEAMASGLVVISSNNTAIPEFLPSTCGYLTNNVQEMVQALIDIYEKPQKFLTMSFNASHFINDKCGINKVLEEEITIIKQ